MEGQPQVKHFNFLEYLFRKKNRRDNTVVSEESILRIIDEGSKEGIIDSTSREMIEGILDSHSKNAIDIMTPRPEIVAIDASKDFDEIVNFILDTPFSVLPVYEGNVHKIIGLLHVQNFLGRLYKCQRELKTLVLEDLLEKPYIVPEAKNIRKILKEMQNSKQYMAIVCDEYGDVSGLITIEDIMVEIIGELQYDDNEDTSISLQDDGSYIVNGLVHLDDINKKLDLELECEHYDTVSGFIIHLLGEIPKDLVKVTYKDMTFEIKNIKGNRVEKLQIYRNNEILA
ncbi:MAG: hypothetical protein ATN31_09465 [Candidatus Epulonipiscioides saccharophilum]|nr:MAG: hypothetical protein ATN31_09465 [Epulopiscium sp. AS2M-Bin001]